MTAYNVIALWLIIILCVGTVGSYAGFTVNGVEIGEGGTAWDSLTFLYNLASFQIDGMPFFLSGFFLLFNLLTGFVILRLVRGND